MDQLLLFALIGLGVGAAYAALGLGLVVTYKGIGIINFAAGAMGMWSAYVYDELSKTGDIVLPVVVVPHRVHLVDDTSPLVGLLIAVTSAIVLGVAAHLVVFRPLRRAPALAKVVASVGVMLAIQALVVMQFGSTTRRVAPILPTKPVTVAGQPVPRDRLFLAAIVVAIGVALWAWFRFTRTGTATRASAESERSAGLAGYAPQHLAGITWVISSAVVGLVVTLAAPALGLNPSTFVLLVVPALACALVGRLTSLAMVTAAGLALGSLQAEIGFYSAKPWWPEWAKTGLSDAVPFVVVVVALFLVGRSLPSRGAAASDPLPAVVIPRNRPAVVAALALAGVILLVITDGRYRFGIISSMIFAIVALSLVVLTGFLGQISFAQAALAGTAGFALSKVTTELGVPFPLSVLLSMTAAVGVGLVVGIPALRIRGAQLAVVTLALAVGLERFVFRNANLTTTQGNLIEPPTFLGLDLNVRGGADIARLEFGLIVLVFLIGAGVLTANLLRGATGRRFLAVRSNERAAAAAGINVAFTKLLGFAASAALAGLGGALVGHSRGQLSAESFTVLVGVSYVAYAYLGGISSIAGALAAGIMAPLGVSYVFATTLFDDFANAYLLLTGVGLILSAIFNPIGVAGVMRQRWAALRQRWRPSATAPFTEPVAAPRLPVQEATSSLEVHDLGVRYGGLKALDGVTLELHSGEIVGLIGPNGAGKTTFIDAVTGFTRYDGRVLIDGDPVDGVPPHERSRRGLARTWQTVELFGDLSLRDNLRVATEQASARSVALDLVHPRRDAAVADVAAALHLVGLADRQAARPGDLSLGQQKMAGVARALVSQPSFLLLDEPAAGLDTTESRSLGDDLRRIAAAGPGILLVDHDMSLVLEACDRVYVLVFGEVIATGPPAEVRSHPAVIEAYLGSSADEVVRHDVTHTQERVGS